MKRFALLFQLMICLLLFGGHTTMAQTFPVQIVPQAIPPAPIYFSDYADESTINSPLRVQVILNDLTITNREVRLKAYFEGNGISFQSNDLVTGAPLLFLEGGIPLRLSNVELAPYFKFENITGISPNVYGQAIPEGAYRFCFEIYDAVTGNILSNRSCAGTVIFQNDPPILIAPENKSLVEDNNPQNIFFQWTPRHINVSNVEYELSIVEIWDNQVDHQAAFLSSPPIFQVTTTATTYYLGPTDYTLLPDRNYAWRVQVKAKQGTEEIGMFKNQGFSEIFLFGNTSKCDLPLGIVHEVKGSTNANILWNDFSTERSEFTVRYRQKGNTDAWFYSKTTANLVTLWDLKAGTEYEYQLAKNCALSQSEFSILETFRTHLFDDDDSTYECGISPNIDVTNRVALESLEVGDKFTAGDFPVTVIEVNGSNGYFNGKGYVTIPYLNSIKVAVEFTNIFINQNKELAEGNVATMYDPSLSGIIDPGDWVDDLGDIINGGDHTTYPPVDFEIDNVTISDDKNEITLSGIDENGNPVSVTYGYDEGDTYIVNGGGKQYSIDENGNLNELGNIAEGGPVNDTNTAGVQEGGEGTAENPSVVSIDDTLIEFTYTKDPAATFGWDDVNSQHEKDSYPSVPLKSGATFYPIHKAVKAGKSDSFYVDVNIKSDDIAIDQLIFKTINGLEIETETIGSNRIKIKVIGSTGYRTEEAIITYKESEERQVVVSSFFIHHLRPTSKANVTLIPVNGYKIPTSIYSEVAAKFTSAGASLNVIEGANFNGNASAVRYSESGLMERLPQEFENFVADFKDNSGAYSNENYYVFVFDENVQPGNNLAGFMPRKSQFGFVFPRNINTTGLESKRTVADVVAHEIGHGVYGMDHPADNDLGTDWIMDKGKGDQFAQRYWAAIGDKGLQFYVFDDDGDGEYGKSESIEKILQLVRCQYKNNELNISSELRKHLVENSKNTDKGIRTKGANAYILVPSGEEFSIVNLTSVFITGSPASELNQLNFDVGYKLENSYHKFNLGDLTINISKTSLKGFSPSNNPEDFKRYLLADEKYDFTESIDGYVSSLISDNNLSDEDYELIKSVANCEAENFEVQTRNKILKLISDKWVLSGYYEDLIDDLLSSTPKAQFDNTLETLQLNPSIYTNIFNGNEDVSRLLDELFRIWEGSSFYDKYHPKDGGNYDVNNRNDEFYREFRKEIEKFIYETPDPDCLDNLADLGAKDLSACISSLDVTLIQKIPYDIRKLAIEKLLSSKVSHWYHDGVSKKFEQSVVRLIKYTPPNGFEHTQFLEYLRDQTLEFYYNGLVFGSFKEETILHILFNKIDDSKFLISGDYRKELLSGILFHYYKSQIFQNELNRFEENLKNFNSVATLEKTYEYDYQNIFRRLWTVLKVGASRGLYSNPDDVYLSISTQLSKDPGSEVKVNQREKKGFIYKTKSKAIYDPYNLVLFTNRSKFNLLKDFSLEENGVPVAIPVPTILLHYVSEVGSNQTKGDIFQTAFDVATLVIPGGQIAQLSKLGKVIYYTDKISSVSSIGGTAFRDDRPELARLFNLTSVATGVISLAGITDLKKVDLSILDNSPEKIVNNTLEVASEIRKLDDINALGKLDLEEAKALKKLLDREKEAFIAMERIGSSQIDEIDAAAIRITKIIDEIDNGLDLLKSIKKTLLEAGVSNEVLKRLDNWNPKTLKKLDDALKKYPKLTEELSNPKLFEAVEIILKNPENAWDALGDLASAEIITATISRLGKSAFFKDVIGKGRAFEQSVLDGLKTGFKSKSGKIYDDLKFEMSKLGKNIDEYTLFSQVQLDVPGGKMVADQVLIKYKRLGNKEVIDDVIILENKLRGTTNYTERQISGWKEIFSSQSLTVRSLDVSDELELGKTLTQTQSLKVSEVIRIDGGSSGKFENLQIKTEDLSKF